MSDFQRATVRVGYAGLNGTGVTAPEKTDIFTRLTDLEALTPPTVIDDLTDVDLTGIAEGDLLQYVGGEIVPYTPAAITFTSDLGREIDGGGVAITTGNKRGFKVDFAGTLTGYTLMSDLSTTTEVDVWASINYPVTNADSITGGNEMAISATTVTVNTTLTSWTTAFAAGTYFWFNVDSNSAATWLGIALKFTREVGP